MNRLVVDWLHLVGMGLRKVRSDGSAYMHSSSSSGTITVIIVEKDSSFTVTINESSEGVVKWCHNLKKKPQEYVSILSQALEGVADGNTKEAKAGTPEEGGQDDIFEVQDGLLVWKQYFPTQKVYGKLGKFKMEKVDYEDAVRECLGGVMGDMKDKSNCILKLQKESREMSKKLDRAMELATKSVKAKEDFEKEIYGKCAAIINAKKHRIVQLKSANRPSPSPAINISDEIGPVEEREESKRLVKKPKVDPSGSDGCTSDTDVDEPEAVDLSSGDETQIPFSSGSRRQDTQIKIKKCAPVNVLDSQELFNNSLEAELYPPNSRNIGLTKNGTDKSIGKQLPSSESISGSHRGQSKRGTKQSVSQAESESSIISELF